MPADTSSIYLDKLCCQAFGGLYISYMIQLYTYSSTIHHAHIIGILLKGSLNNLVGCLFIACILKPFLEFLNNVIACLQHAQIIDFSVFNYIEVCLQHAQILGILFHVFKQYSSNIHHAQITNILPKQVLNNRRMLTACTNLRYHDSGCLNIISSE